jgi:putative transposase
MEMSAKMDRWHCHSLYIAFVRTLQLLCHRGPDEIGLAIEVVKLGHEVAVLRRPFGRPALRPADRAVVACLLRRLSRRRPARFFVQPKTLPRWHRDLVRRRGPPPVTGTSTVPAGTVALVVRLARENPDWEYRRVHGALRQMDVGLAASNVYAILQTRHRPVAGAVGWQESRRTESVIG